MRLSEEWIPRVAHIGPFVIRPDLFFTGPESLAFDLLLVLSYLRRLPRNTPEKSVLKVQNRKVSSAG
jgi:hypothetical protein